MRVLFVLIFLFTLIIMGAADAVIYNGLDVRFMGNAEPHAGTSHHDRLVELTFREARMNMPPHRERIRAWMQSRHTTGVNSLGQPTRNFQLADGRTIQVGESTFNADLTYIPVAEWDMQGFRPGDQSGRFHNYMSIHLPQDRNTLPTMNTFIYNGQMTVRVFEDPNQVNQFRQLNEDYMRAVESQGDQAHVAGIRQNMNAINFTEETGVALSFFPLQWYEWLRTNRSSIEFAQMMDNDAIAGMLRDAQANLDLALNGRDLNQVGLVNFQRSLHDMQDFHTNNRDDFAAGQLLVTNISLATSEMTAQRFGIFGSGTGLSVNEELVWIRSQLVAAGFDNATVARMMFMIMTITQLQQDALDFGTLNSMSAFAQLLPPGWDDGEGSDYGGWRRWWYDNAGIGNRVPQVRTYRQYHPVSTFLHYFDIMVFNNVVSPMAMFSMVREGQTSPGSAFHSRVTGDDLNFNTILPLDISWFELNIDLVKIMYWTFMGASSDGYVWRGNTYTWSGLQDSSWAAGGVNGDSRFQGMTISTEGQTPVSIGSRTWDHPSVLSRETALNTAFAQSVLALSSGRTRWAVGSIVSGTTGHQPVTQAYQRFASEVFDNPGSAMDSFNAHIALNAFNLITFDIHNFHGQQTVSTYPIIVGMNAMHAALGNMIDTIESTEGNSALTITPVTVHTLWWGHNSTHFNSHHSGGSLVRGAQINPDPQNAHAFGNILFQAAPGRPINVTGYWVNSSNVHARNNPSVIRFEDSIHQESGDPAQGFVNLWMALWGTPYLDQRENSNPVTIRNWEQLWWDNLPQEQRQRQATYAVDYTALLVPRPVTITPEGQEVLPPVHVPGPSDMFPVEDWDSVF